MKKFLLFIFLPASLISFAQSEKISSETESPVYKEPLFQLGAAPVYSSIDLSRYANNPAYRGTHLKVVTHIWKIIFFSTEYSMFPVHGAPSAWDDIHTRKFDFNGQVSFATHNNLTHIYFLMGADKHEWTGRRTAFTDLDQNGKGIPAGTYVNAGRWGMNAGCGFTQSLYENIGLFGDYRFCLANAKNFEKVRIMDVMMTIGLNISIPHPNISSDKSQNTRKKTFGIGKKVYRWTNKGAN